MVRLYGHNYSIISEKSKCSTVRFYTSIESWYGGNCFTVIVGIRNGNFFMAPTVCLQHAVPPTNKKIQADTSPASSVPYTSVPFTTTYKQRASYFKSTLTFVGPAKHWKSISAKRKKGKFLRFLHHNNN